MNRARCAAAALLPLLCAHCADTTDTRRWSSATLGDARSDAVKVNVYLAEAAGGPSGPSPLSVTSLAGEGQAELIRMIARRSKRPGDVWDNLSAPADPPPAVRAGQPLSDRVPRVLVATLSRPSSDYEPGDRIMRAVISIRPLNFTFGNYTIARTNRTSIEVATVERTSTAGANITLTPGPAATASPVGGSVGGNVSRGLTTNTTLSESAEELTVDVHPECMQIVREGFRGADLTGNTLVNLSTIAETTPTGKEGCAIEPSRQIKPGSADEAPVWVISAPLTFRQGTPQLAAGQRPGGVRTYPTKPLSAQVRVDFEVRRVVSGQRYYTEGSQAIRRLRGSNTSCLDILRMRQLLPPLFGILGRGGANVFVEREGSDPMALTFTDYEQASLVARWMDRARPSRFGGLEIRTPPGGLYAARFEVQGSSLCSPSSGAAGVN